MGVTGEVITVLVTVSVTTFTLAKYDNGTGSRAAASPTIVRGRTIVPRSNAAFGLDCARSSDLSPLGYAALGGRILSRLIFRPLFGLSRGFGTDLGVTSDCRCANDRALGINVALKVGCSGNSSLATSSIMDSFGTTGRSPF